jgi:hypothetical protein
MYSLSKIIMGFGHRFGAFRTSRDKYPNRFSQKAAFLPYSTISLFTESIAPRKREESVS